MINLPMAGSALLPAVRPADTTGQAELGMRKAPSYRSCTTADRRVFRCALNGVLSEEIKAGNRQAPKESRKCTDPT